MGGVEPPPPRKRNIQGSCQNELFDFSKYYTNLNPTKRLIKFLGGAVQCSVLSKYVTILAKLLRAAASVVRFTAIIFISRDVLAVEDGNQRSIDRPNDGRQRARDSRYPISSPVQSMPFHSVPHNLCQLRIGTNNRGMGIQISTCLKYRFPLFFHLSHSL